MYRALAAVLALATLPASSETLAEFRNALNQRVVTLDGYIGTGLIFANRDAIAFRDLSENDYPVELDAGRRASERLAGCEFKLLTGGTPCRMQGKAEILLDEEKITLVIIEITDISPPGPMR